MHIHKYITDVQTLVRFLAETALQFKAASERLIFFI